MESWGQEKVYSVQCTVFLVKCLCGAELVTLFSLSGEVIYHRLILFFGVIAISYKKGTTS